MRVIALLSVFALALSGCAGEPVISEPTESSELPQESGNETVQSTVPEAVNRAPIAIFEADVLNGTAPLLVNFTIDASDMDGDNMTWAIAQNGTEVLNGTEFPAAFNLTLLAGNHTVALTVSDGTNDTVEILNFTVLEAVQVEPAFEQVRLSQAITLACPNCWLGPDSGESKCVGLHAGMNGVDCAYWEVDPAWFGQPYTIGGLFLPSGIFWESCDGTGYIQWDFASSGVIPEGAGCIVVSDIIDPVVTAVVTIG